MCTIGYHPNNYIIEDRGHSWGTQLKKCLAAGFHKASNYLGKLHFKDIQCIWLSKVNVPALPKERLIKGLVFFPPQKFVCTTGYHPNNYIIDDLGHLWGTPLKNCLAAVFNKGLIRHLTFWGTLHFKDLQRIWLSKVNGPALPKEKCIKLNKVSPEENGSKNKKITIEARPPQLAGY